MTSRRWMGLALLVAAVVVGVVLVGPPPGLRPPLDPASSDPLGTRALVLLVEELGGDVEVSDRAPGIGDDVALVLDDDLGEARRDDVQAWVEAGGTLVVADPVSLLHPFPVQAEGGLGFVQAPFDSTCALPALASISRVEPPGGSVGYELVPGADGCFLRDGAAYVAVVSQGQGNVVAVGGAGLFTNQALGDADNAVLAASLLVPRAGTSVAFLRPPAPGTGDQGLLALVGDNVKAALVQLGIAFGVYVLWRARRLGSPVTESQPVALESSELVVAVGNLLQQARHHDEAARLVGDDLRRRLAQRLGLGGDTPARQVAEVAAARTGVPVERVLTALVPAPLAGSEDLVAHAAEAEALHREVVHA